MPRRQHKRFEKTATMPSRTFGPPVGSVSTRQTRSLAPVIEEMSMRRDTAVKHIATVAGDPDDPYTRGGPQTFHEAYIDEKRYLVPDSTLKAMADIINLKMRAVSQPHSRFTDGLPTKMDELAWYQSIVDKLEKDSSDEGEEKQVEEEENAEEEEEEEKEQEEEEQVEEEEEKVDEEVEEEEEEVEEEESVEDEEKVEEEEEKQVKVEEEGEEEEEQEEEEQEEDESEDEESTKEVGNEVESEEESEDEESTKGEEKEVESDEKVVEPIARTLPGDTIYPGKYHDPEVKRFLISGHFRADRTAIYIINQYAGPSVFGAKDPQFYSKRSEKDADIFIAGEFYKESILEEDGAGRPKMLHTKPRKISIDSSSRIYENEFNDVFIGKDIDVRLSGKFIRHTASSVYTPLLAISLKRGSATSTKGDAGKSPTPVYISRPFERSVFESWMEKPSDVKKSTVSFRGKVDGEKSGNPKPSRSNLKKASVPYKMESSRVKVFDPWELRRLDDKPAGRKRSSLGYSQPTRDSEYALHPTVTFGAPYRVESSHVKVFDPWALKSHNDVARKRSSVIHTQPSNPISRAGDSLRSEVTVFRSLPAAKCPFRGNNGNCSSRITLPESAEQRGVLRPTGSMTRAGNKKRVESQIAATSTNSKTGEEKPINTDVHQRAQRSLPSAMFPAKNLGFSFDRSDGERMEERRS